MTNHTLPLTSILVTDRLRKDLGDIDALADSIKENGLIQPLLVAVQPDGTNRLVAGGRRYAALTLLEWTDIPVYLRYDLADTVDQRQVEIEENIRRKSMSWQEVALGIKEVHKARAHQAALKSESWTQNATGHLLDASRAYVTYALAVAEALEQGDEEVAKQEGCYQAYCILLERNRKQAERELDTRKRLALRSLIIQRDKEENNLELEAQTSTPIDPAVAQAYRETVAYEFASQCVTEGDSIYNILPTLEDESFNHIYTDIPYGIDMAHLLLKGIDETSAEHDADDNEAMFEPFLKQSYRLLKPRGFCVFWCDMEHWGALFTLAKKVGFSVQRWPLIWTKTSACKNSAAAYNFTKNYEIAIVCRKDGAILHTPQSTSYFNATWESGERSQYKHPFVKPHSLHKWILSGFTTVGDTILNPFCGEGSEILSSLRLGLKPTGYDINPTHVIRCREHIQNLCLTNPSIMNP